MRTHSGRTAMPVIATTLAGLLAGQIGCAADGTLAPAANQATTSAWQQQGLPDFATVKAALTAVRHEDNGGFNLDMWGTIVDREGKVVLVVFTGANVGDQWPGSRVISAQKANTANAFSLPGLALSTANLYAPTQPGGTLFGLQESNPVDEDLAYGGETSKYGTPQDFLIGKKIGGINVFGGGLALYGSDGKLIGALGVSGDASCADHIIAWKLRHRLSLDYVPAGVSPTHDDNIIYDIANGVSASGFGHPICSDAMKDISNALPVTNPIRHRTVAQAPASGH